MKRTHILEKETDFEKETHFGKETLFEKEATLLNLLKKRPFEAYFEKETTLETEFWYGLESILGKKKDPPVSS